jgi:hypothetical protein
MTICTIDNRVATKWITTGMPVSSGTMSYTEPIQGCVNDCFFLAALASVAWAAPAKLNNFPNYQFYNPAAGWNSLQTGSQLAVDAGNNLVYARTSSGYIWPCLYEKAYAKWKSGQEQPDIKTVLAGGNPLTALQNICGGTLKQKQLSFLRTGKTIYPTVAFTKHTPANGALAPDHSYTVTRQSGTGYEVRNPCGGSLIFVSAIDASNFSDWGYVIPG